MPTGTADLPLLRGYVPYGELQVNYDLLRRVMGYEIAMWEGAGWPYLRSPIMPGTSGVWVYPSAVISAGPSWSWNPNAGNTGWPRGPNAVQVYAKNGKGAGGQGLTYSQILDPVISQFVVGLNFAFLFVGTPMAYQNPGLIGAARGDTWRKLITLQRPDGVTMHRIEFRYQDDRIAWAEYAVVGGTSTVCTYYGERCSFLFVHGSETGTAQKPRVYIGKEDGSVTRLDFTTGAGTVGMLAVSTMHLWNLPPPENFEGYSAGGTWEYGAYFIRAFEDAEACAICRDALGFLRWDPYVVRRIGWRRALHQLAAMPMTYGRVGARPRTTPRVGATPSSYQRVSASARATGPRVSAAPTSYQRISAKIRIGTEALMQATPLCPGEINYEADNILELADVLDELTDPPTEITSATSVECEVWDRETGLELTAISPVTLSQVGATNHWRGSVYASAANGFALNQRLQLIFVFDGGANLRGRFEALPVVRSATS